MIDDDYIDTDTLTSASFIQAILMSANTSASTKNERPIKNVMNFLSFRLT